MQILFSAAATGTDAAEKAATPILRDCFTVDAGLP